VRQLYNFAARPDLALYFRAPLEVAIDRVLTGEGRTGLKYYEAGMDLNLSTDSNESYRLFQGKVVHEYERMVDEFGLTVINADRPIAPQHEEVIELARPILERHLEQKSKLESARPRWEIARAV
jgi:dTMP kinase